MSEKYIPMDKWPEEKLREELERNFARWDDIHANGCSDPNWPDGVNLNLVRNHIIFDYRLLREKVQEPVQMSFFADDVPLPDDRPIPPEVPDNYMAPHQRHPERIERLKVFGWMA